MLDPPAVIARKWLVFAGKRRGHPWMPFSATENWAALVNKAGAGLGIWAPGDYQFHGGFFGPPGSGGPGNGQTGYIAPNFKDIIDHNIVYRYHYVLIVGSLAQIRRYVYAHAARPAPPRWVFAHDRQHWIYSDASDTGWPIRGRLDISLAGHHPELIGPTLFWPAAKAPVLYLDAALKTTRKTGSIRWRRFHDQGFSPTRRVVFPVDGDGRYHRYAIRLAGRRGYSGAVAQLRIDPVENGGRGMWIKVKSIGFVKSVGAASGKTE